MNEISKISYNEWGAGDCCFSVPGALSVVPVRFSFPAPELNFSSWFSVTASIHTEWLFIQERFESFFISIAGLIRTAFRKSCRKAVQSCIRTVNVLRARVLKLSYGGRRL